MCQFSDAVESGHRCDDASECNRPLGVSITPCLEFGQVGYARIQTRIPIGSFVY